MNHFDEHPELNLDIKASMLVAYGTLCATGFLHGVARGTEDWLHWLTQRYELTINSSDYVNHLIDPIINIGRDAGYFGWYCITSGVVSALLIGTFPVSFPLLALMTSEKKQR